MESQERCLMRPPRFERARSREGGFTLIELLIVVAIIGILAAAAIPGLQRSLLKARTARLAKDAKTLYSAFVQFNIDYSCYPSTTTPTDRALNRRTLNPLVSKGYMKTSTSLLSQLQGKQVTSYDSPNVSSSDTQFWAVLTLAAYPSVQVVVADTNQFPGFEGTQIDGCFFVTGSTLVPVDENIFQYLTAVN